MPKVIDLNSYKKQREELVQEAKNLVNVKDNLSDAEKLAVKQARLIEQQSQVMDALLNDIALLVGKHIELQNQFMIVSAQAYLAIQVLKDKGVILSEELEARWADLMAKVLSQDDQQTEMKEEAPQQPHPLVEKLGAYEPTQEDVNRILAGEDSRSVLPPDVLE